ncbi:hypothetical protein WN51_09723 [Melipona quadrifasciata]|uniref:Uncharacterized protein n=1 Tax=Melipona quadrifasciata TaxID=166423 RepID=A0A0N0U6B0_9HYME|nr:hypothetical protein WN51_09723 [Melipona quadrifasciata]
MDVVVGMTMKNEEWESLFFEDRSQVSKPAGPPDLPFTVATQKNLIWLCPLYVRIQEISATTTLLDSKRATVLRTSRAEKKSLVCEAYIATENWNRCFLLREKRRSFPWNLNEEKERYTGSNAIGKIEAGCSAILQREGNGGQCVNSFSLFMSNSRDEKSKSYKPKMFEGESTSEREESLLGEYVKWNE